MYGSKGLIANETQGSEGIAVVKKKDMQKCLTECRNASNVLLLLSLLI